VSTAVAPSLRALSSRNTSSIAPDRPMNGPVLIAARISACFEATAADRNGMATTNRCDDEPSSLRPRPNNR